MRKTIDLQDYKSTLIQLSIHNKNLQLVNPFASQIKKRIIMMKNKNTFRKRSYAFLMALLVGGSFFLHACQKENLDKKTITQKVEKSNQSSDYLSLTNGIGIDTIIVFDPETYEEQVTVVHNIEERVALFPGCDESASDFIECSTDKLMQFVYSNLLYPNEARLNDIEGMVVLKLKIDKKGYLADYSVVKSADDNLSEATKKVVDKIQNEVTWIPGQKNGELVNSELILPVKFKLQ